MARSGKGAGNPLLPIAIIAVVVVAIMAAVFTATGTEPPDQATIVAEDDVAAEPAGAGTVPEGEADEAEEGVTDVVDEVDPAAPGQTQIPAEDNVEAATPDQDTEGEVNADEQVTGTADAPVADDAVGTSGGDASSGQGAAGTSGSAGAGDQPATGDAIEAGEAGTGGADGQLGNEGSAEPQPEETGESASDEFLMQDDPENVDDDRPATTVPSGGGEDLPEGRDAETQLDPESGEEVIRDTDEGGAGFVPTPSGPEGRDDDALSAE